MKLRHADGVGAVPIVRAMLRQSGFALVAAVLAAPAAADIHVRCAAGDSLQAAILAAAPGEPIRVSAGLCRENVRIDRDALIIGDGPDIVMLQAVKADGAVIRVARGASAHIVGLSIRGGHVGISSEGALRLAHSSVRYGTAGGIAVSGGTFEADSIVVSDNAGSGVAVTDAARAEIQRSAIRKNRVEHNGGGAILASGQSRVSLRDVLMRDNESTHDGGAIQALNGSEIVLDRVRILNNISRQGSGGGIALHDGRLSVMHSAVSFNLAEAGNGGGIALLGKSSAGLQNTTLHNNIASFWFVDRPGGAGGALHVGKASSATLLHATVHDNWARQASGIAADGSASIEATLFAANFGGDCGGAGSIDSRGWNLLQQPAACPLVPAASDLLGVAAQTARYGNHGGPAETVALLRTSPAVDRIPHEACTLGFDQHDAGRRSPAGGKAKRCDIGAGPAALRQEVGGDAAVATRLRSPAPG